MAAALAGNKRSYQQMDSTENSRQRPVSVTVSERQSPPRLYSGVASRASTPLETSTQVDTSVSWPRKAAFEPSASIVLIGIRGVGKSTLGVLAATAYNRRLIDSDKAFLESTGTSASAYRKLHGSNEYQRRHNQVLENTLETHSDNAVIVSGFSDLEKNGAGLIRKYAESHPVIYVSRDAEGIQSQQQAWTIARIQELQLASSSLLRSCSNFEFFNLSENNGHRSGDVTDRGSQPDKPGNDSSGGSFLTLKRAERDFLRLLRNVIGDHNRGPSHQSAYPLSKVRIEDRAYSFSVSIKVSDILADRLDLDDIQIGADCVELIVDFNDSNSKSLLNDVSKAFAIVRRATILPILITPKLARQKTQKGLVESLDLTDHALRLGPELCTIDLSLDSARLRQLVTCKGSTRIVGALELQARPVDGWHSKQCIEAYKRAAEIGCDLAKITMPAQSIDDAFAVHLFKQIAASMNLRTRLIAYSIGPKGRLSKCLNGVLTSVESPFDYNEKAIVNAEDEDDSLSAKAITQARFSSFIFQPLHFYIFGADVSHSLSPPMHNAAYAACGMQYVCSTHSSYELEDLKTLTRSKKFGGSAVAHPFKTTVLGILDGLSPHANAIGAVNTVVPIRELSADGDIPDESTIIAQSRQQGPVQALYGFNTDWIGIRACVRRGLSPANTIRPQSSALVCGAGGMARSAIYSLLSLGVQNIFLCNRTLSNAVALVEYYNNLLTDGKISELIPGKASEIRVEVLETFSSDWPSDVRPPTIIVNCIPRQGPDDLPTDIILPEAWLKSPTGGVVVDVAYRLPLSPLVWQIRERAHIGWILMDGFDVLPEQAYSQFELFTGRRAPRKLMREGILKYNVLEHTENT